MRGITSTVATTLLIALAVIVGVSLYFWVGGQAIQPEPPAAKAVPISVSVLDAGAGRYLVANEGTSYFSIDALHTTAGADCDFGGWVEVAPGKTVECTIAGAPSGTIMFYHDAIGPATVVV